MLEEGELPPSPRAFSDISKQFSELGRERTLRRKLLWNKVGEHFQTCNVLIDEAMHGQSVAHAQQAAEMAIKSLMCQICNKVRIIPLPPRRG